MTVLFVTGVNARKNRESDRAALEAHLKQSVILLDPEKDLQPAWNQKRGILSKLLAVTPYTDKAYDVFDYRYFRLQGDDVDRHFERLRDEHQPDIIVGHSLGSVIAAKSVSRRPVKKLITLGSPLWIPFFWGVDLKATHRNAGCWENYWSPEDLIGCWPLKEAHLNRKVLSDHDFEHYLPFINQGGPTLCWEL